MLLGLIAAAAPIILHLLRKRTARRMVWGAWMFLMASMRLRRRRVMIEDVILLVVRTLILALAALAFARPFLPEMHLFGNRGMDKDVVIVLDRSASMNLYRPDGRRAFDVALEEARELIKLSPHGTAFGLVLGDGTPQILTSAPFSTKREVLDLLDDLKAGSGTMDVPRTLAAAGEVLAGGNNPGKEVVIFGDGQGYGWKAADEREWRQVANVYSRFRTRPPVVWRVLDRPAKVKNVAIESVQPSRRIIGTDRPATFTVTVLNAGTEAVSPGDLTISVDGGEAFKTPLGQILPGLSRTVNYPCEFKTNGHHDVVTSIALEDDIACDNVVSNPVEVIDELKVLLVNGNPAAEKYERPTAFLEAALRPEVKGTNYVFLVKPQTVRAGDLETTNVFGGVAVTVLCDVPMLNPKAATNLANWVAGGGGLLVMPGEKAQLGFYTNWQTRTGGKVLSRCWTNFNPKCENLLLEKAPVLGRVEFDEGSLTNDVDVTRRFSDDTAAFVAGKYGKGLVGISAVPFDMAWTTLPARPQFVPMAHEIVYALTATNSVTNLEDTRWRAREGNLEPLTDEQADQLRVHVDLMLARLKDDALAAVVGRSFGVEIWRPFALIALFLAFFEIWFRRKVDAERGTTRARSAFRTFLRAAGILALVWMQFHLVWVHDVTRAVHRRVAVFTDRSLSMCRHDLDEHGETNKTTRLDLATNVAARIEKKLADKYDVEPWTFGGETTDFAQALEYAMERIPAEELAGAVFVTDGRRTGGAGPEAAARRFAHVGARISSVVIGSVSNRPDVAIADVRCPSSVFLGDKVRAGVTIRADRMAKKKITVKFFNGDKELDAREFEIDKDAWTKDVRFMDDPEERGLKHYRVAVETPDDDVEAANDEWPIDVSVSDDRTNVLVADRRPRWEFRYLRNLFYGRDKSVHLQYFLTEPDLLSGQTQKDPPPADATREFGDAEAGALPRTRNDWRKFDVLILGDLPPETLTPEVVEEIRYCVEERGAMAVFIAGPRNLPAAYAAAQSKLLDLLPVSITNAEGAVDLDWSVEPFKFALSPSGRAHGMMELSDSQAESEQIWSGLPDWSSRLTGATVKPGAEVFAFAGDSTALKAPLVIAQHKGRGKVVFLATDEMWRLRYRVGDTYHHRFWGNLLKWGAGVKLRDGNRHARVGTDSLHYSPGAPAKIVVRLQDRDSLAIADGKAVAEVTDPKGRKRTLELTALEGSNGYYEALVDEADEIGEWKVAVKSEKAAEILKEDWPKELSTTFRVAESFAPLEYTHLSADEAAPREMARLTGGSTLNPENAEEELSNAFGAGRGEVEEHVENPLWNHWSVFALLALAFILEWILRKKRGLA